MYSMFDSRIQALQEEISKINSLEGKELFDTFSVEEKINNIKIDSKGISSLSTNIS